MKLCRITGENCTPGTTTPGAKQLAPFFATLVSSDWGGDACNSRDTLVLLQHYLDLGLKKTAIARQLLDRKVDPVTPRRPARRAQQLDPFTR
jgi:hypothetical protein